MDYHFQRFPKILSIWFFFRRISESDPRPLGLTLCKALFLLRAAFRLSILTTSTCGRYTVLLCIVPPNRDRIIDYRLGLSRTGHRWYRRTRGRDQDFRWGVWILIREVRHEGVGACISRGFWGRRHIFYGRRVLG